MTFLELVQSAYRLGRIGDSPPSTLETELFLEAPLIKELVQESWKEIQLDKPNWLWMRRAFQLDIVPGITEYRPEEARDEKKQAPISRFGSWLESRVWAFTLDIPPGDVPVRNDHERKEDWKQRYRAWLAGTRSGVRQNQAAPIRSNGLGGLEGWDAYRDWDLKNRPLGAGAPNSIAASPEDALLVWPAVAESRSPHVVAGSYRLGVQTLRTNDDEPDFHPDFHSAIVYAALQKYGHIKSIQKRVVFWEDSYRKIMKRCYVDQLPKPTISGSRSYRSR